MSDFVDLTGAHIGEWEVIRYAGKGYWICKCSCGNIKYVDGHELRRRGTKSCGHNKVHHDLTDAICGEWHVLHKDTQKSRHWICECSCGEIKSVHEYSLTSGSSKSCGHKSGKLKDMLNKTIGEWHVDSYAGKGMWNCTCSCGNMRVLHGEALRRGETRSCGCKRSIHTRESKIAIHGDYNYKNKREPWQIEIINSKEMLEQFISDLIEEKGRLVTNQEIADELGVTRTGVYTAAKRFGIEGYKLDKYHSIHVRQNEVTDFIQSIYSGVIRTEVRDIISPYELDIHLPDVNIAIEYNGNYWHSDIVKSKKYHQDKTIACAKLGIRLIHIFEYEWVNTTEQQKLKNYLKNILYTDKNIVYARNTEVEIITSEDAYKFEEEFHLQGGVQSRINVGCIYNNELIGVMTFSTPRFNNECDYELTRLCFKPTIGVVGGSEKMFKLFERKFEPKSIVAYANIAKFTGNIYSKLGFEANIDNITPPNYVWVNAQNDVLTRYQTQKHKLIEKGFGTVEDTEESIMNRLGYLRVYDSGNLKMIYRKH